MTERANKIRCFVIQILFCLYNKEYALFQSKILDAKLNLKRTKKEKEKKKDKNSYFYQYILYLETIGTFAFNQEIRSEEFNFVNLKSISWNANIIEKKINEYQGPPRLQHNFFLIFLMLVMQQENIRNMFEIVELLENVGIRRTKLRGRGR